MTIHFLQASTPLTKSYSRDAAGALVKTPYPFVWDFTSHDENPTTLLELEAALRSHAARGHCMLKGSLTRPLVSESRAGSTRTGDETSIVVLDLDGLPVSTAPSIDAFMQLIGLGDVSYVAQWSASYGIDNQDLRAHVFLFLDKPHAAPLLKQWLIQLNHTVPALNDAMSLTKTGNAISWPLDTSACQNDKLIYIAPPRLTGIKDPVAKNKRIVYVKKKTERLALGTINSTDKNRALTVKRIESLRDAAGLPKRKITYKMHGTTEVMVKPDVCTITEMKQERGFVYFNLNGGDSWAYYHPENNPDFIYSFKGETAYLTKELLPDYWDELCSSPKVSSTGELYLAFCDRTTSAYWRGTYNQGTDTLDLHPAKNETQVRHFARQHGMPLPPDFIPEWDLTFDPHDNVRVDATNRTVNLFQPTQYMLAPPKKIKAIPKTINKVISHVLGGEPFIVDHFINWLAYIVQTRKQTRTAWVLHGVPGTGKGVLMQQILRPLFGAKQTAIRRMEELNEPYNHWMKNALMVFIDEVQTKALQNEAAVMAKLKNFITEITITIRAMHSGGQEAPNYTNWIFASNMTDPVRIEKNDRRMNVAGYQKQPINLTPKEVDTIESELQAFHDFLIGYKVDLAAVSTPLDTVDRQTMIAISESSVDTVGSALLEGDFEFFISQMPTGTQYQSNALEFNKVENYRGVLKAMMDRTEPDGSCAIARDELRTLFDYCVGNMPSTPNKFTSLLKHHRIHTTRIRVDGEAVYGMKVNWKDAAEWPAYMNTLFPKPKAPKAPAGKMVRVK